MLVSDVQEKASDYGFALSCEPIVGRFLALLAAKTPSSGRVLELGTGAGVGLAWILHGLGSRTDVAVTTVEHDRRTLAIAQMTEWPSYVRFLHGDAEALLPELGLFDLIFADAEGGKWDWAGPHYRGAEGQRSPGCRRHGCEQLSGPTKPRYGFLL